MVVCPEFQSTDRFIILVEQKTEVPENYRYTRYKGYDTSRSADLKGYADSGKISGWASAAMGCANAANLVTGTTDTALDPSGNATRAQMAAIIQRFCVNVAGK